LNICPDILRQRLIVEGIHGVDEIDAAAVRHILGGLTRHLGMTPIADTLIFSPDSVSELHHGIGGFQAWAESGCSLYTWREQRLFTIDIYSCKGFDAQPCLGFVKDSLNPRQLHWRLA
jgi:S-adenosylmethionine decarboxylase